MGSRPFTPDEALRQVRWTCSRKHVYRSLTDARRAADHWNEVHATDGEGGTLVAYRCPSDPSHAHLGHPLTVKDMEMIALAIRARTGCAPTTPTPSDLTRRLVGRMVGA